MRQWPQSDGSVEAPDSQIVTGLRYAITVGSDNSAKGHPVGPSTKEVEVSPPLTTTQTQPTEDRATWRGSGVGTMVLFLVSISCPPTYVVFWIV